MNIQKTFNDDDNRTFDLLYQIIESEEILEEIKYTTYGISVHMNSDNCDEIARVESITTDKQTIESILSIIANQTVTPISLQYVVEDMIS